MPGKLRQWLMGAERSGERAARSPGRSAAILVSKLIFVALAVLLALFAISADATLLALAAGILLAYMIRSILPNQRIRNWFRRLWSGEAGARTYDRGRDRLK